MCPLNGVQVSLDRIEVCLKGEVLLYFVVTHMHNKSFIYFVFFFFTGCQLILGHAVDRDLLLLVQGEVRGLIKDYNTFEKYLATLRDQDKLKETALDEHHKRLEALEEKLQEASEDRGKETKKVLERLLSFERQLSKRLQEVEEKVDQLEQAQTKTDDRVSQLEQKYTEVTAKVDQLDQKCIEVEQIGQQMKTKEDKPGKLRLWSGPGCLKPALKCSLK